MTRLIDRIRGNLLRNQGKLEQLLFPWHRGIAHRVLVVLFLVLTAFIVRRLIGPPELGVPFLTFFPAAAISAVFGGFWAGMLATSLGSTMATYFFIPPYDAFSLEFRWDTVFANLVYILDEIVVCSAIAALHRVYLDSKSQNAELNTLVRTIPDMVWLRNQDGAYVECNPAVERFYGLTRAELIGRRAADLFPRQAANALHKLDQQALVADGPLTNEEWIVRESDGRDVLLEATVTPMRRSDGEPIGVLGIARDITGRRVLENEVRARTLELERERRLLATIFEHTGDGIIAVDSTGSISLANHEARRLLGVVEPNPDARLAAYWPQWPTIASAATAELDVRWEIEAHGRVLSLSVSALAGEYGAGHVIVARDVSMERRLADERRELDRQMFQMEKLATLGELAMGVAHEIGNPLGGMKAVVQSLQFGDELPSGTRRTLDRLGGEIDRLAAFLRTFRGVAAPPQIHPADCRLRDLVDDALFWVRKQATTQAVAIENTVSDDLAIRADPGQFKQVMLNLLVNAIHAMPDGGELKVGARIEPDGNVLIEVIDNGCGIDQDILTRIFDPFFTTRTAGSGLGLAVVRKVVSDHGARIGVASEVGRGSCFSLHWPGARTELAR